MPKRWTLKLKTVAACSRLRSTATSPGSAADIIIVDDPHDISDVRNPELLDATVEIFDTEVRSRLNNRKTDRILVIAHRIHDRDLSAHLLKEGKWAHVTLPLEATRDQTYETRYGKWHRRKGELLRPEAEDEDDIARLKKRSQSGLRHAVPAGLRWPSEASDQRG